MSLQFLLFPFKYDKLNETYQLSYSRNKLAYRERDVWAHNNNWIGRIRGGYFPLVCHHLCPQNRLPHFYFPAKVRTSSQSLVYRLFLGVGVYFNQLASSATGIKPHWKTWVLLYLLFLYLGNLSEMSMNANDGLTHVQFTQFSVSDLVLVMELRFFWLDCTLRYVWFELEFLFFRGTIFLESAPLIAQMDNSNKTYWEESF